MGMDDDLTLQCTNAQVNHVDGLRVWLNKVKCMDELIRADCRKFEAIAKAQRERT